MPKCPPFCRTISLSCLLGAMPPSILCSIHTILVKVSVSSCREKGEERRGGKGGEREERGKREEMKVERLS